MDGDLERLLHEHSELIFVNLWDSDCEASQYMDQLMRELEHRTTVSVLRLNLTEYRDWAIRHGIYGTPALVAYYRGRPLFRLIGRVTLAELLQRMQALSL